MIIPLLILSLTLSFNEAVFQSYWNIQFNKCTIRYGMQFDFDTPNIIHNTGHTFYGDKMNIIYNPGEFPRIDEKSGAAINNAIPQLGDVKTHLNKFMTDLNTTLKNATQGPLVLDFEVYKPVYQSAPYIYRNLSYDLVKSQHPTWSSTQIREEAKRQFNKTSITFFETLLDRVKLERPNTLYGYYHFPYCNNYRVPYDTCAVSQTELNNDMSWMYNKVTALYPSLYTKEEGYSATHRNTILSSIMKEAARINVNDVPIIPYINPIYKDNDHFLERPILLNVLWIIKYYGGHGAVIWTMYDDVKTSDNCTIFKENFDSVLSPALQCMHTVPEDFVQVLRNRYPIYADEINTMPENADSIEEEIDGIIASGKVDMTSSDNVYKGREIISVWCKKYL